MPKTYNDLYLATRTALKSAGVEAYALEARLLVAYAVGKTKEEFVRDLRLYTSDENEQKIRALLQRRIAGEPLAYLIGEWEFHGLPITVTPRRAHPAHGHRGARGCGASGTRRAEDERPHSRPLLRQRLHRLRAGA